MILYIKEDLRLNNWYDEVKIYISILQINLVFRAEIFASILKWLFFITKSFDRYFQVNIKLSVFFTKAKR